MTANTSIHLGGVTVATVVPFDARFAIDWKSYDRLLAYCTTPKGINAVFVNGHAGEGATLTGQERAQVIRHTRAFIGPNKPLMAGLIAYSTVDAIAQAEQAQAHGADVAVIFPMPQFSAGASSDPRYLGDLVDQVLSAVDIPISIFQQSVASGAGFSTAVLEDVCQRARVIAVKEGSGDIGLYERNLRHLKAIAPHVQILASNYHWFLAQMASGADGILSGMASMTPHLLCDLWTATAAQDLPAMRAVNDRLYPIVHTIYGAPPLMDMHTRLKVGLQHLGIIDDARPRPPLLPVSTATSNQIIDTVQNAGLAQYVHA